MDKLLEVGDRKKSNDVESSSNGMKVENSMMVDEKVDKEVPHKVAKSENANMNEIPSIPKMMLKIPQFSQILMKKEDTRFKKLLFIIKSLSVNIPLVDALPEISGYGRFLRYLVTKSMNFEMVEVSHHYSVIVSSKLVVKK